MADKHIAVANCTECPAYSYEHGACKVGGFNPLWGDDAPPPSCPLRQGRVILFLNEKREG